MICTTGVSCRSNRFDMEASGTYNCCCTHVVVYVGLVDVARHMHVEAVVVVVDVQVGVVMAQTPCLVRYPVRLGPLVSQVCTYAYSRCGYRGAWDHEEGGRDECRS